ncbi:MAG: hypothetical protein LBL46_05015 [Rickettsiales bacterium]|jgi:hypothetical protein|nr:hypothetical protein [Rickettsiales bacterium]
MKRLLAAILIVAPLCLHAADERFVDCGPGFVMSAGKLIDGIPSVECKKLWCRDLETGKAMGTNNAANGYKDTARAGEVCDDKNNCVSCWGERKMCGGEDPAVFNADMGAYTKRGAAVKDFVGFQSGSCWKWRVAGHDCPAGKIAMLVDGEYRCLDQSTNTDAARAATKKKAVKRTAFAPAFKAKAPKKK